jgi:hypothetical protein
MADSVDDLELELGRVSGAGDRGDGGGPAPTPGQQVRRALRGKHVCPFCGTTRQDEVGACPQCSLEDTPTTRAATRSKLGPWFVLQSRNPSAPGMNFATMLLLIQKGRVTARSVIRGPTTSQFWRHAAKVKGVSREFGLCWNCGYDVARNARVCSSCKRLQEPPINPDMLLETGNDAGIEDLAEKMWAQEQGQAAAPGPASNGGAAESPVDRLASRGGVRREVPLTPAARRGIVPPEDLDPADLGDGRLPGRARRRDFTDSAPDLASVGAADVRGFETRSCEPLEREAPSARAGGLGFGVGYDDELGGYRRPRRRGSVVGKLFKVLLVAVLLGAVGVGAIAYLDPDGAGRRLREHARSAGQWISAKMNKPSRTVQRAAPGQDAAPTDGGAVAATTQEAGAPPEDFSKLTPEQAKYKVYQLWEAGEQAAVRGEHKKAVALWESIKRLPGVKEEDWPLGLNARIELTKKNIK